jgi:hypothetical protein
MNRSLVYLLTFLIPGIGLAGELKAYTAYSPEQTDSPEISRSSIYIQFSTSALFASLTNWKNNLHISDGTHPSSNCMIFGAESGCVINRYFQVGIGYEFFFTTKVTTLETSGDQIGGTFFYGSLRAGTVLESLPDLFLFGSLDIGSLSATETMENYIVQNYERTGTTTAYRFMAGTQYYASENWSLTAGAGYFSGNVSKVTAYGQTIPNFTLNFSGIVLRAAVNYHIPL